MSNITKEQLDLKIQMIEYFQIPNTTVTICTLHLASGYIVTGESSVVNPLNFDAARGREIALDKATKRLYDLECYARAERAHQDRYPLTFPINLSQAQQLSIELRNMDLAGAEPAGFLEVHQDRSISLVTEREDREVRTILDPDKPPFA